MKLFWIVAIMALCSVSFGKMLSPEEFKKKIGEYKAPSELSAHFEQVKSFKNMSLKLKSSGEFQLTADRKVVWKVAKPAQLTVTISDEEIIMESKDKEKKVEKWNKNQIGPEGMRAMTLIVPWVTFDQRLIAEVYDVEEYTERKFNLYPKDKKSTLKQIDVELDKKGNVVETTLFEGSGDQIEIKFSNHVKK